MLLGASGTGKELLARAVHEKSGRKGEFIAINCAAIPENLLEAELFGYERGAFTGAVKSNVGKIELARGRHACSSTRSATSRCRCRSSCCASSRSG